MVDYKGATRFEIELEFVQSLANPWYLNHLATQKYLDQDEFLNYLTYLQYWRQPEYARYLQYPGPTLRMLQLLQQPSFRKAAMGADFLVYLISMGVDAAKTFSQEDPLGRISVGPDGKPHSGATRTGPTTTDDSAGGQSGPESAVGLGISTLHDQR